MKPELLYRFKTENGVIVSNEGHGLHFVTGSPGSVEFPEEVIWGLHQFSPGVIHELAHTHPIGMWELSARDKQTLKTWAYALYPFPARLSVITYMPQQKNFNKVTALGILESKEAWILRGKEGSRRYRVVLEENYEIDREEWKPAWLQMLLEESYQFFD
jgi:hypothetical protein